MCAPDLVRGELERDAAVLTPASRLGSRISLSAIPSFLADPNHAGITFNGSESSSSADAIRGVPVGVISDQPQARGPGRAQA